MANSSLNFTALVDSIRQVHEQSAAIVNRTVNTTLTLRNWVIGAYIREYEQNGADRARYGESLLDKVAERLGAAGLDELTARYLRLCRQFAAVYPGIWRSVTAKSAQALLPNPIWRSLTARSERSDTGTAEAIWQSLSAKSSTALDMPMRESATPALAIPVEKLLGALSFTHLEQLIAIEDPLKRAFYEIECIRGNWSVRALKRQIVTLYFERSGLSKDKEKLAAMVQKGAETTEPKLTIRDPYIFEFLGLRAKDAMTESELEAALLENLRKFLLELGHGFCLEAQQKSIVIGKTRGFVDLVFYHRILKCHVLVELKVDEFRHEHLGQLNTYVTWYREHMMAEGDNPPVGLLLCTGKDHALVRYATASMDNRLFVSKYAVELPTKEELEKFLHAKHLEIMGNA
jgi:predicted nuclease of restriction endonuclease-like (RecB) superfamily